jgi:hypothetical protein
MTERDLHALLHAADPEHFSKFDHDRHMAFSLLEYEIRDAITTRGWGWDIGSMSATTTAQVWQYGKNSVVKEHAIPAVALALAYITMVEVAR